MKVNGVILTLEDLMDAIHEQAQEETGEDPENMSVRLTLSEDKVEELKEGKEKVDVELADETEEVFLVTWEDRD